MQIQSLAQELRQAREGERTLRGSVAARSDALRGHEATIRGCVLRLKKSGLPSVNQGASASQREGSLPELWSRKEALVALVCVGSGVS